MFLINIKSNIAINHRAFGAGLKTANGFSPVMAGVSHQSRISCHCGITGV